MNQLPNMNKKQFMNELFKYDRKEFFNNIDKRFSNYKNKVYHSNCILTHINKDVSVEFILGDNFRRIYIFNMNKNDLVIYSSHDLFCVFIVKDDFVYELLRIYKQSNYYGRYIIKSIYKDKININYDIKMFSRKKSFNEFLMDNFDVNINELINRLISYFHSIEKELTDKEVIKEFKSMYTISKSYLKRIESFNDTDKFALLSYIETNKYKDNKQKFIDFLGCNPIMFYNNLLNDRISWIVNITLYEESIKELNIEDFVCYHKDRIFTKKEVVDRFNYIIETLEEKYGFKKN